MAGKLSFSIAINLLTENFKRGTSSVKNAFRSMQAQILTFAAAMGFAGVSLSNFFSQLIQVARETSKAVTALKNVSGSTAQFADNLRYTTQLAQKYGVYVNDITSNYAKFTAAASIAGMAIADQRKLFESLSRAAAGFGMSADDTNGMFLAVTQMMGKGKIQAEELRGQLGERLPIAMQAMAKAAGTTVAGLDSIMKKGKLLSAEVLPKFADALNEMLPNVDTDNIETSLNRLKNAFQEFTQNTGIQDAYKSLIDGLTNFVNYAKDKLSMLVTFVISLISGKLLANIISFFAKSHSTLNNSVKKHEVAQAQKQLATQKRIEAEKLYEATLTSYETKESGKRLASKAQVNQAKKALDAAELNARKANLAAQTAAENAAAVQSLGFWKKTGAAITASAKRAGVALKAVWSTAWPMALVTILSVVVTKIIDIYREAKRVRSIFNEYKNAASNISTSSEKAQLESLKKITEDTTRSVKDRANAWTELASRMNVTQKKNETELDYHKRINEEIAKRIKLLENTAKADFYASRKVEAEDKFKTIQKDLGIQGMDPMGTEYLMQQMSAYGKTGSKKAQVEGLQRYYNEIWKNNGKFVDNYENKLIEMSGYWDIMADATKEMENATVGLLSDKPKPLTEEPEKSKKKTDLQKAEEAYAKSTKELTNKLANRVITEKEYDRELKKLNKATYDTLSGLLTPEQAEKNKTFQSAKTGKPDSKIYETEIAYRDELEKYTKQFSEKLITENDYKKAQYELIEKTLKEISGIEDIGEAGKAFVDALNESADNLRKEVFKVPAYKERDKTYDYKKTDIEKLQAERDSKRSYANEIKGKIGGDTDELEEKLKAAKGNLEAIKAEYGKDAEKFIVALNDALNNVTSLEDALKIAQVKKDVKDLSKELNAGLYSGVKEIASSSDRLVSAFSSLHDVFGDEDATAWERIMAVWNAMINTVDAFMSIVKTIEELTKITEKLSKAKEAEAAIDTAITTQKVTNAGIQATAETTTAATTAAAAKTEVAANTAVAGSAAVKSVAGIPIVGIALAGAALAAIIAMMASLPKFACGGIIQGSPTGDLNLARVNGGEMILNGSQQATLFQIANGKGIRTNGMDGKVEFEVRYDRLVGVLKNGDQKNRRGR